MQQKPCISIVVATWNCRDLLARMIESLQSQTFKNWQLLLLDNCSDDGTAEMVATVQRQHPQQMIVWSSCADSGIYDAWNRGLALASGQYLCFVGADDVFCSASSLAAIASVTQSGADLITARNAYYSADGRFLRIWGAHWNWSRMRQSMNIAHPGMLIRHSLFARFGGFRCEYRICGDYEWFLRLTPDLRAVHLDATILEIVQAGVSHTCIRQVFAETFRAQRASIGTAKSCVYWLLNWIKYWRRRCIGLA